ncbi:NAD(P)H-dependent glycerol-3-phosphate dehydrogenase [Rhodoferax aquaticus]|uniref:Glycerol-3-phosphate dehydrogenase [NAD(P)+] n=1 Tax=Rhodoferax aquaticus TaxID=2527691 RepID=A0A515EM92_9BURK|nr:NAD(P)H-dependent glycerol-3-phosphate dehydrogenase [Rhodoferax aquaticus]QDL53759.1 NAD(P)-dependent glycerol-3-phosphate dehydrogenase [Rhodoferax aquaticus]
MKIIVLGAGAWGTALAVSACTNARVGHEVTLWARDAGQIDAMSHQGVNARYLPTVELPSNLSLSAAPLALLGQDLLGYDLVVLACPMAGLRGLLSQVNGVKAPVAWLCKGFESGSAAADGLMGHEILSQVAPGLAAGVLSGPSFALEVAQSKPTALVAASSDLRVRDTLVAAFHSASLRVYANDDVVGVEVGGGVKNVLAIATGLCDGLNLGLNARAALITRGLAEMTRLGVALGARAETFMGLSGLGDLVLTATGDLSRNRRVGFALSQGQTLAQAVASLGHVAEGVYSARTVVQRARTLGVEMPISQCVVDLLDGKIGATQAVTQLMGRGPAAEGL